MLRRGRDQQECKSPSFLPQRICGGNPERARAFYRDTLGLRLTEESGFALVFDANGVILRVTIAGQVTIAPYTVLGWQVPVTWIGIVDGILTIVGVIVANRAWIALGRRGREPGDFAKMAIGYAGVGAAFLFAGAIATLALVPVILWVVFFLILDLSYGWVEPPIQSLVSRDSPPQVLSSRVMPAALPTGSFAQAAKSRSSTPKPCCRRSPKASRRRRIRRSPTIA